MENKNNLNDSQNNKRYLVEKVNERYNELSDKEKEKIYMMQKKNTNKAMLIISIIFIFIAVLFIYVYMVNNNVEQLIFGCISIAFVVVANIYTQISLRNKEKIVKQDLRNKITKELKVHREEQNLQNLKNKDFKIDKEIFINGAALFKTERLLIDTTNKCFIYVIGKEYSNIIQFKDIINYEVYEDGNSVVKGSAGRALIGGTFFGLTGAIIGSSGKRKVSNYCSSLKLLIRINDIDNPQIEITFINSQVEKDSFIYKNSIKSLQEISSYFEYMINSKTLEKPKSLSVEKSQVESKSKKEQLIELRELFEEGLITEEDYNKKKQEILN